MKANRWLVFFGLLTVLWGTAWGGQLGRNEDALKAQAAKAIVVNASFHKLEPGVQADDPKVEQLVAKYWSRTKRVHLHAEGIGTLLLVFGFVAGLLVLPTWGQRLLGIGTGLAGFIYPIGWLVAAQALPTLGSGGAKHLGEAFFVPGGLGFLVGTAVLLGLFVYQSLAKRSPEAP